MITIDQLLESVDLDFEPRWVTKDDEGDVTIWAEKPTFMEGEYIDYWSACGKYVTLEKLKLAKFDGKDSIKCIYEVPRKTDEYEQNLEKLRPADSDLVYRVHLPRKTTGNEIEQKMLAELERKLNAIVDAAIDAINELKEKGAKNE